MKKFIGKYPKDAVMGTYNPIVGMVKFIMNPNVPDIQKSLSEELAKYSDYKLVVYHMPIFEPGTIMCALNTPEIMSEYLAKEVECVEKSVGEPVNPLMNLGFGQQSGQEGLMHRSIYTDFFGYEKIEKLHCRMVPILEKKMPKLIQQFKIEKSKFTDLHLREFLTPINLEWLSDLIFGCKDESELDIDQTSPEGSEIKDATFPNGLSLIGRKKIATAKQLDGFLGTSFGNSRDLGYTLSFGLTHTLGLTKKWRDHAKVRKILDRKILSVYYKRYSEYTENTQQSGEASNILDLCVRHNKNCEKNGNTSEILTENDITGDVMIFQFAGLDTSLQAATSCLLHLTKSYPEWLDKIRADGVENIDQILKNKSLDLVMKETLRMWNPAMSSFWRKSMKPMEICGIEIPKGTIILPPCGWNKLKPYFKDAGKFRPERFVEEVPRLVKEQRNSHTPFYAGKRMCMGYHLGELSIKISVGNVLKMFELENRQEGEIKMEITSVYYATKPQIGLRLK